MVKNLMHLSSISIAQHLYEEAEERAREALALVLR